MQKILAKELGSDNIQLLIRLWEILTFCEFDMGNIGNKFTARITFPFIPLYDCVNILMIGKNKIV